MNATKVRFELVTAVALVGACLLASHASVAAEQPSTDLVPFGVATAKWNRGERDAALADFRRLAQAGDIRSQLLLGLALLEGKDVQRDVPRGFAWLQIASSDRAYSFGSTALEMARKQKEAIEPRLSGADLIRADRIASEYLAAADNNLERREASALAVLMGRATDPAFPMVPGCALDRSMAVCAAARLRTDWSHSCTGDLPTPDVEPSWSGPDTFVSQPEYPPAALARAWEGVVLVRVHVDRSGYPCRIVLLQGSSMPAIDETVLESVRGWRARPATKGGQPVESLDVVRVEYMITDYALGKEFDHRRAGKILSQ